MKSSGFIPGGSFLIARALFQSAIWTKPPQYLKLFLWLIGRAAFQDGHTFQGHTLKRGQLVTSYSKISEALAYHANRRIIKPTLKEIRLILAWLESERMIICEPLNYGTLPNKGKQRGKPQDRTGAYLGLLISVINFDSYQDLESYKGRPQAGTRAEVSAELGQTPYKRIMIEKNDKETPPAFSESEIPEMMNRYPDSELILQAFESISSTRKTGKISDSIRLKILQSWSKHPVESVIAGIKTYLSKNYAEEGKSEKYLLGIIRNLPAPQAAPTGRTMKRSGSPLLDTYYREQGYTLT